MDREISSCVSASDIRSGASGPFDARSLSCWLALADAAGVEAIPAREIVVMSAETVDRLVSGKQTPEDMAEVDRWADDMEALPSGWMVRHDHCGSEDLKIAAAVGLPPKDGGEGVGWARWNNRALPRFWDERVFRSMAQSLVDRQVFLARPWIEAKTRSGEDPHREGSEIAGEGTWPREWRVYVIDGQVAGISNYYIQAAAEGDDEDRAAVERTRAAADAVVAVMRERQLVPHDPMVSQIQRVSREVREKMPIGSINCSLDFMEAVDGRLLMLEGGPAYTPAPYRYGAHPCAFLGRQWPKGVAYALDRDVHPLGLGGPDVPNPSP